MYKIKARGATFKWPASRSCPPYSANMSAPAIKFYTSGSPNGHKVAIVLEELELPYTMRAINMSAIEHKEEWFTKINPNGRIPAIEDVLPDGTPIKLFESGSIQQYLVERYDTEYKISYPRGTKEYLEVNNWVSTLREPRPRLTSVALVLECQHRTHPRPMQPLCSLLTRDDAARLCPRPLRQ